MPKVSKSMPAPPCALLVMCNECGRGVEVALPIDQESLALSLAHHVWFVAIITPPGQVPILFGALCGDCFPKVFAPEILRAAEERRQWILRGETTPPGTGG